MTSNQHSSVETLREYLVGAGFLPKHTPMLALADLEEQLKAEQQFADKFQDELAQVKEQLEVVEDILRGFLHDADNGDRPGEGLRDMARAVLNPPTAFIGDPPEDAETSIPASRSDDA